MIDARQYRFVTNHVTLRRHERHSSAKLSFGRKLFFLERRPLNKSQNVGFFF